MYIDFTKENLDSTLAKQGINTTFREGCPSLRQVVTNKHLQWTRLYSDEVTIEDAQSYIKLH